MTQRDDNSVERMTLSVAGTLWAAQPGELAAVRRMKDGVGAPLFWRLAARHDWRGGALTDWAAITRMLALLTPTGERAPSPDLDDDYPFGKVLCDGGDRNRSDGRPVLSESRLARLLAARGDRRRAALERAMRMLARHRPRFRLPDLAWAVLNPEGGARDIARDYYARLDKLAKQRKEPTDG